MGKSLRIQTDKPLPIFIFLFLFFIIIFFASRYLLKTNPCETRYQTIKKLLDNYQRPFTMLEICTAEQDGYCSHKAAADYDSVCVMLKDNKPDKDCNNCDLDNIVIMGKKIETETLNKIKECEHFDVVLLFSPYNILQKDLKKRLDYIFNMGTYLIVALPDTDDDDDTKDDRAYIKRYVNHFLKHYDAKIIGTITDNTTGKTSSLYLAKTNKKYIERRCFTMLKLKNITYTVCSTFHDKFLKKIKKGRKEISKWIHGINLITFKALFGSYPSKEILKKEIKKTIKEAKSTNHKDWVPSNMIVQGNKIKLIDFEQDKLGYLVYSDNLLKLIMWFVDIDEPDYTKRFKLIRNFFETVDTLNFKLLA
ncbi:hypothetical protein ACFLYA_00675 [Candidatus Dependentiae bacterium]